ncbi:VOC family protein [Pseudomonas sp. BF-R-24]|uniref:VOC family protein n=1 Tax=Pseudomonas sp. BF-R-24 TaxID=2832386 RepID=UPI001CBB0146|nr:VOC family protein [Pseudomonas sp. BF-R-24]
MSSALLGPISQIGYLVESLEQSMERWRQHLGVGPWTLFRNVSLQGKYRGEPVTVTIDVGLAYQGDIQIELIQVTNDAKSPYRDAEGHPIRGMHHVAWVVDDFDQTLARLTATGLQMVFEASNPTTRVAYLENESEPGVLYEIIHGIGMRGLIQQGIAAARHWDGSDAVHIIDVGA